MSKVHVISVASWFQNPSNDLSLTCMSGFNPIRHTLTLLEDMERIESVTLWSDLDMQSTRIQQNTSTRLRLRYRHLDHLPQNGMSPILPRAIHHLTAQSHVRPRDLILFMDLMLFVPDSHILMHGVEAAEREEKITLGVRRAQTHPCLMFSLRDPAIMDLRTPAHQAVTYKDLYRCDYNIIRDAKTNSPIHRRQDFPSLYESLRGLAIFKPEWLEEGIFPHDPTRIHAFFMEGCFLIETPLDLLKASIAWKRSSREAKTTPCPLTPAPIRVVCETEVVDSRETACKGLNG
jgi:hypothetical protein